MVDSDGVSPEFFRDCWNCFESLPDNEQTSRFVQIPIVLLSLSDVDVWSIRSRWSPVFVVSLTAWNLYRYQDRYQYIRIDFDDCLKSFEPQRFRGDSDSWVHDG